MLRNWYSEHKPAFALSAYVVCYWTLDASGPGSQYVLPDGCIDLLFEGESLSVVGTMSSALHVPFDRRRKYVGVRFRPGGAVPFLRAHAASLTDRLVCAADVLGAEARELSERLWGAEGDESRVATAERYLLARLGKGTGKVDPRLRWACSQLEENPALTIYDLAGSLGLSRQHMRRLFLEHVGVSSKAFARIVRLSAFVDAKRKGESLSVASCTAGYADQAHMTREFKALVGLRPREFFL